LKKLPRSYEVCNVFNLNVRRKETRKGRERKAERKKDRKAERQNER